MPNIATILKAEVARLTRKELKLQIEPLRKQVGAQRKMIAALRADVAKIQKGIASGSRKAVAVQRAEDAPATRSRFSASGLKKLRKKLGLTMEAFGILLGVSAQAIYMWERGQNRPRAESVQKIAIARGMTKRQVQDLLAQHAPSAKPVVRRTRKPSAKKAAPIAAKKASSKAATAVTKKAARKAPTAKKTTKSESPPASKPRQRKGKQKPNGATTDPQ
ncbi:transcriptional regulator with XRE-family HTH domain [Lysobacter enzymogenes]|uniref:helix-turn-helix transcriptional regulator n=1 Tax=Lysobacter enzymogenes TaxID=69 RepID=UPI003397C5E2